MKRKHEDTPMNRHVRRYLHNTGSTITALEKEAGLGRYTINGILQCRDRMGPAVFNALNPIVKFTAEHHALMKEMFPHGMSRQHRLRSKYREWSCYDPQPWTVTVANLMRDKPVYARAW